MKSGKRELLNMKNFLAAIEYCVRLSISTSKLYTFLRIIITLFNTIIPFISMFISKLFIDILVSVHNSSRVFFQAIVCLLILILTEIVNIVLGKIIQYVQSIQDEMMQDVIQTELMEKSMSVDFEFFDTPNYMDMMQSVKIASMAIPNMLWNILAAMSSIGSMAGAFVLLGKQNLFFAILIMISSIPSLILSQSYTKELYKWHLDHINEERKMGYFQSISSQKLLAGDIRLFGIKEYIVKKYEEIWRSLVEGRRKMMKSKLTLLIIVSILPEVCACGMLCGVVKGVFEGVNTVGDCSLYSGLLVSLTGGLITATASIAGIYEDKLKVDIIKKFKDVKRTVLDNGKDILEGSIEIEFKNVYFRYPNDTVDIIKNLSMHIYPNEKICIVGENGEGKSTIIKLLLRFYDVTRGIILINGKDIKQYTIESLRKNFSIMFQQYDKYAFSLKENIILSDINRKEHSEQDIISILEQAGAYEIYKKTKYDLDLCLSKLFDAEGLELSGGEQQKIALARTMYRNSDIVILDEPSAALDPISESIFFDGLKEFVENKTMIFITHRMNTVHLGERIIVLKNGTIKESGSHEELMKLNQEYAKMYNLQAEKYKNNIY